MGLMEAARCAGSNEATKASISTETAASASTNGSKGLTPNKNEFSRCEAAAAPSNPKMQPAIASLAAEEKTRRRIPDRCEPNAIRMAISCARRAADAEHERRNRIEDLS